MPKRENLPLFFKRNPWMYLEPKYVWRPAWIGAMIIGGVAAFIATLVVVIVHFSYAYDKGQCPKKGHALGREVKFVRYNYWTWECLTPDGSGHWIPLDKLRVVTVNGVSQG